MVQLRFSITIPLESKMFPPQTTYTLRKLDVIFYLAFFN